MSVLAMKKMVLMTMSLIAFSSHAIACGSNVMMSVPHIHDEAELIISIKNTQRNELKQISIDQIYAGELEKKHYDAEQHQERIKAD